MPSIDWKKPAVRVDNIGEYVRNSRERANHTFRIEPTGKSCYLVNGETVSPQQFDQLFPAQLKPKLPKGGNIDRRKTGCTIKKATDKCILNVKSLLPCT